jgi:hypothetical protein
VLKAHGSANALTIKNTIMQGVKMRNNVDGVG